MNKDLIKKYTAEVYDEIVGYRRHLHAHPELSAHEKETTKYLASIMEENSIPYTLNPAGEGLIARIQGSKPGKVLAFRGDIDALPIPEETGLPFASENPGVLPHGYPSGLWSGHGQTPGAGGGHCGADLPAVRRKVPRRSFPHD